MLRIQTISAFFLVLLSACSLASDQNNKRTSHTDIRLQKLFQASLFHHYDIEVGAPSLYDYSPFGGDEAVFLHRIAEVVGSPKPSSHKQLKEIANLYIDYCLQLKNIVSTVSLPPGTYNVPDIQKIIQKYAANPREMTQSTGDLDSLIQNSFNQAELWEGIEVTHQHLDMLKALHWNIEYQGRRIFSLDLGQEASIREEMVRLLVKELHNYFSDPQNKGMRFNVPVVAGEVKTPYGNRNYYYWDLLDKDVLEIAPNGLFDQRNKRYLFSELQTKQIDKLQYELSLALQAMALYGEFK